MKTVITSCAILLFSFSSLAQRNFFCQSDQFVMKERYKGGMAGLYDSYYLWEPGTTLYIRFMNGSTAMQNKVLQVGKEWEKYANIKFVARQTGESHIRVSFNDSGLIKPAIGSIANIYPQDETNCYIDTSLTKSPKAFRTMVLHVFGHIIGLQHENEVPLKGRRWNSKELQEYAKAKEWIDNELSRYIIEQYSVSVSNGIAVDRKSMMYYNPKQSWTNEKAVMMNDSLSNHDKTIASLLYPFKRNSGSPSQLFKVEKLNTIRIEKNSYGLSFYPEFDINITNAHKLQMGIFFYTKEGNEIENYDGKYSFDDHLATVKGAYLTPNGTYHLNYSRNDVGLFLPYTQIPVVLKGKQAKIVFKVFFTDQFNMENQKEFTSKPMDIILP